LKLISTILSLIIILTINAQNYVNSSFAFLNIPVSAKQLALGSDIITLKEDNNSTNLINNPSLISENVNKNISLSHTIPFHKVNMSNITCPFVIKKYNLFAGLQYVNYGKFAETDITGTELGNFRATDYSFVIGTAKHLDSSFTLGINIKLLVSSIYSYNSTGISTNAGISYNNKKNKLIISLLMRNYGKQIKTYNNDNNKQKLPLEYHIGIAKSMKNAPFSLYINISNIQKWEMPYTYYNKDNYEIINGEVIEIQKNNFINTLLYHFSFGTEFNPSKNFSIQLGYNYRIRHTLKIDDKKSIVGLSTGISLKVKKISIGYAILKYHLSTYISNISITIPLANFVKIKK